MKLPPNKLLWLISTLTPKLLRSPLGVRTPQALLLTYAQSLSVVPCDVPCDDPCGLHLSRTRYRLGTVRRNSHTRAQSREVESRRNIQPIQVCGSCRQPRSVQARLFPGGIRRRAVSLALPF